MAQYYGVTRSGNELSHYGVKGMKWGVRKAVEKKSDKKLARQYNKALKKLEKLDKKADVDLQKKEFGKHARRAVLGAGLGATGIHIINSNDARARNAFREHLEDLTGNLIDANTLYTLYTTAKPGTGPRSRVKKVVKEGKGLGKKTEISGITSTTPVGTNTTTVVNTTPHYSKQQQHQSFNPQNPVWGSPSNNRLIVTRDIGRGMTALGFGTAAYQAGRAIAAKRRTTAKGHAKAVAKRNAWKNEMRSAFKGTQYANLPYTKKKSSR